MVVCEVDIKLAADSDNYFPEGMWGVCVCGGGDKIEGGGDGGEGGDMWISK